MEKWLSTDGGRNYKFSEEVKSDKYKSAWEREREETSGRSKGSPVKSHKT